MFPGKIIVFIGHTAALLDIVAEVVVIKSQRVCVFDLFTDAVGAETKVGIFRIENEVYAAQAIPPLVDKADAYQFVANIVEGLQARA